MLVTAKRPKSALGLMQEVSQSTRARAQSVTTLPSVKSEQDRKYRTTDTGLSLSALHNNRKDKENR